jgi:NAD(P)-dependent dehydrogenase (short-subunit alcohol dehydrogenase family)
VSGFDLRQENLDRLPKDERCHIQLADVADEAALQHAFRDAVETFGPVSVCVAGAGKDLSYLKHHESMADMPVEQWADTMRVNGQGTFLTARTWMQGLRQYANEDSRNLSLIMIGSEAGTFGVRTNADYSAS